MKDSSENGKTYRGYIETLPGGEDDALRRAREAAETAGLPPIQVSAAQGRALQVLALATGARRILEIGTLGAYSAIWLARALPPDGRMVSLEINAHHAEVARANLEHAGLGNRVEVRIGPALESLAAMGDEEPFDLVFIDADKDGYVPYLEAVVPLVREGGVIAADNTLPEAALEPEGDSGALRYNTAAAARADLVTAVFPMLRGDGLDGLTVSVKRPSSQHG